MDNTIDAFTIHSSNLLIRGQSFTSIPSSSYPYISKVSPVLFPPEQALNKVKPLRIESMAQSGHSHSWYEVIMGMKNEVYGLGHEWVSDIK